MLMVSSIHRPRCTVTLQSRRLYTGYSMITVCYPVTCVRLNVGVYQAPRLEGSMVAVSGSVVPGPPGTGSYMYVDNGTPRPSP